MSIKKTNPKWSLEDDIDAITTKDCVLYNEEFTKDIIGRFGSVDNYKKSNEFIKVKEKLSYTPKDLYFNVYGAGKIRISETCSSRCGDKEGFNFGVEWGEYGFAGGVLPKEEAKKLAKHILNSLK